jgi:myb proto-oncogene protein
MHPNMRTTRAPRRWTPKEDKKLASAVTDTRKKKCGKELKIDWVAVTALVPGRTKVQCCNRWRDALDPSIGRTTARAGQWTADEDKKLKDALPTHGAKIWETIAALVPGRTKVQCRNRWHNSLISNTHPTGGREGKWTADEDKKLKDVVPTHGAKNWEAIAALVPGRTKVQCCGRWHDTLDPSIGWATARTGKWTADEDKMLKDALPTYGGKNWEAVAALVPGRTKGQCRNRWHNALDPSIGRTTARAGKWTAAEYKMLKDAVPTQGVKNWEAIAELVPGRTKVQCCKRWNYNLISSIDPTGGREGK